MNRTPRLDDRRDRLIAAAARLFRQRGYERTSVRQLADAVGILSGSVFHHFASKEDILMAVMTTTIEAMTERLQAAGCSATAPLERLRALVRTELDLLHGDTRDGVAVAFFQWHSLGEGNQTRVLALREDYERIWLKALEAARAAGLIRADPFITRRLLTGALGWTIYWYRPDGPLDTDHLAEEIICLVTGRGSPSRH
ncbi:MAG: TetR/AcrR family transcriptional regulator [Pseudomonadota bacterium]|nr:MAG: TetR/AcrR family transcriptional regulator [Pseudomonadota bacterium]